MLRLRAQVVEQIAQHGHPEPEAQAAEPRVVEDARARRAHEQLLPSCWRTSSRRAGGTRSFANAASDPGASPDRRRRAPPVPAAAGERQIQILHHQPLGRAPRPPVFPPRNAPNTSGSGLQLRPGRPGARSNSWRTRRRRHAGFVHPRSGGRLAGRMRRTRTHGRRVLTPLVASSDQKKKPRRRRERRQTATEGNDSRATHQRQRAPAPPAARDRPAPPAAAAPAPSGPPSPSRRSRRRARAREDARHDHERPRFACRRAASATRGGHRPPAGPGAWLAGRAGRRRGPEHRRRDRRSAGSRRRGVSNQPLRPRAATGPSTKRAERVFVRARHARSRHARS